MAHKCIDIEDKRTLTNDNPFAVILFLILLFLDIFLIPGFVLKVVVAIGCWAFSQFIVKGSRRDAFLSFRNSITAHILVPTIDDEKYVHESHLSELKQISLEYNPKKPEKIF